MDPERSRLIQALETHRVMLTAYLTRLVHEVHAGEDLVQEVFVAVLSNPQLALRGNDFGAYLRGIARHLASRHYRRMKAGPQAAECIEAAWEPADIRSEPDESDSFLKVCGEALKECVEALPRTWRTLFDLRYDKSQSYDDIAGATQNSSAAVRMSMTRIRRRLADCIQSRVGSPLEEWAG